MANIIIGEQESKIISRILRNDEVFYSKWIDVFRDLNVPFTTIKPKRTALLQETTTAETVYYECIQKWRSAESKNATLEKLLSVLFQLDLKGIADNLRNQVNAYLEDNKNQQEPASKRRKVTVTTANLIIEAEEVETIQQYLGENEGFHSKWESVFRNLNVSPDFLVQKKVQFLRPDANIPDIYKDCLNSWRSIEDTNATAERLISTLFRFQLNDLADELLEEFNLSLEDLEKQEEPLSTLTTWKDLSKERREVLLQRNITFQKRVINIATIFQELKLTKKARNNFLDEYVDQELLADLHHNRNPIIFQDTLPRKVQYYIERFFMSRSQISENVFKSSRDIFLVSGIEKHMLSQLAANELTDTASQQAEESSLKVRYLLWELSSDFDDICEKTIEPVHWLQHKEGSYSWKRSRGNMEAIQSNIGPDQIKIQEKKFVQHLEDRSKAPICICDSPGMGKTMLLANQGRLLQEKHPERLVLFIALSKFISKVKNIKENLDSMVKVLLESFCQTSFEANLGLLYFEVKHLKMDILFDGLDEVNLEDLELALRCLKLFDSLPAVRVWVTTRPHHRDSLENSLQQLSHNIQGFDRENQISFLVQYWAEASKTEGVVLVEKKVKEFAKACLAVLKNRTTDVDRWAGVPLQCMLIAEVFRKKAVKFSNPSTKTDAYKTPSISISTFKGLFDCLVYKKIELFKERYPELKDLAEVELQMSHIYYAFQVVVPEIKIEELQLGVPLSVETLLKVGLMEATSTRQTPQFLHLTFAEYFVAKFLYHLIQSEVEVSNVLDIIFNATNSSDEDYKEHYSNQKPTDFKFPVVMNFLNCFLGQISSTRLPVSKCFGANKIKSLMKTAIRGNHLSLFHWFLKNPFAPEEIISEHLFLAVQFGDPNMIEQIIKHFKREEILGLTHKYQVYLGYTSINVEHSLLHVAAKRGNYKIFEYLVKNQGFSEYLHPTQTTSNGLIHLCVTITKYEEDHVIKDRVQIISAILKLNRLILEEEWPLDYKQTPLLCDDVHLKLLQALISNGANALAQSKDGQTVLHRAAGYLSRDEYDHLIRIIPVPNFKRIIHLVVYYDDISPMHKMIERLEPLESSLKYFIEHGHDVNIYHWELGYNYVGHAIRFKRSVECVKTLLSLGGSGTNIDQNGSNLLHVAVLYNRVDVLQRYSQEYGINTQNEDADTPLHMAFSFFNPYTNAFTLELLIKLGANVNSKNHKGNTPLHEAAAYRYHMPELIDILLKTGADPIIKNMNLHTSLQHGLQTRDMKFEVIQILLNAEENVSKETANLNLWCLLTRDGGTSMKEEKFFQLAEFFVQRGGNMKLVDEGGSTIFQCAVRNKCDMGVKFLMKKGLGENLYELKKTCQNKYDCQCINGYDNVYMKKDRCNLIWKEFQMYPTLLFSPPI